MNCFIGTSIAHWEGLCTIQFCHRCMTIMFHCEQDLLANLIVLTPKLARRKFREHIFESWGWKCAYCDKQLDENTATIDHIVPKHKGGHSVKTNLCAACSECNKNKSTLSWKMWFENQDFYCEQRAEKIKNWVSQKPVDMKLLNSRAA